jgi:hypothetical protein
MLDDPHCSRERRDNHGDTPLAMITECANRHKSIVMLPSECGGIFVIKNSRAAFVDQAQDQGIKAVRSGAG